MKSTLLTPLLSLTLLGCDLSYQEPDETIPQQEEEPLPQVDGAAAYLNAGDLPKKDRYAIGSSWYDYDPNTHSLSPKRDTYLVRRGPQTSTLVQIKSYYNAKGESGYFSLKTSSWDVDTKTWSTPSTIQMSQNVKETYTCLSIEPVGEISCDDPKASLLARTVLQPVPAAGFAVSNPAIYAMSHFLDEEEKQIKIVHLKDVEMESVTKDAPETIQDSFVPTPLINPHYSRVGWLNQDGDTWRNDLHVQINASMKAIEWRVTSVVKDDDGIATLDVEFRCQDFNLRAPQAFQRDAPLDTLTVRLKESDDDGYHVALLALCPFEPQRADIVLQDTSPIRARWPQTNTFDLVVESYKGKLAITPAPGNLVQNWSRFSKVIDGEMSAAASDLLEVARLMQ